jgi:hypothetical protein
MKAQEQSETKRRQEAATESRKSKCLATGELNKELCIFCCEGRGKLHECATKKLDEDLRKMAIKFQDTALLARILGVDLVVIEAKYHLDCLMRYRNKYRSAQNLSGCNHIFLNRNKYRSAQNFPGCNHIVLNNTDYFKL